MTTQTTTPITINLVGRSAHPVHRQYARQDEPQPAYISLDCRNGSVEADYNGEIGNAVPLEVHHGHVLRFDISPYASSGNINAALRQYRPQFQRIVNGYSEQWDGSNHIARYSPDAEAAIAELMDRELAAGSECRSLCRICYPS